MGVELELVQVAGGVADLQRADDRVGAVQDVVLLRIRAEVVHGRLTGFRHRKVLSQRHVHCVAGSTGVDRPRCSLERCIRRDVEGVIERQRPSDREHAVPGPRQRLRSLEVVAEERGRAVLGRTSVGCRRAFDGKRGRVGRTIGGQRSVHPRLCARVDGCAHVGCCAVGGAVVASQPVERVDKRATRETENAARPRGRDEKGAHCSNGSIDCRRFESPPVAATALSRGAIVYWRGTSNPYRVDRRVRQALPTRFGEIGNTLPSALRTPSFGWAKSTYSSPSA